MKLQSVAEMTTHLERGLTKWADSRNVKKTLKSPFAQRPMMGESTQVHDSLNWEYPIDAYYTMFIGQPYNVWGSTGAS